MGLEAVVPLGLEGCVATCHLEVGRLWCHLPPRSGTAVVPPAIPLTIPLKSSRGEPPAQTHCCESVPFRALS